MRVIGPFFKASSNTRYVIDVRHQDLCKTENSLLSWKLNAKPQFYDAGKQNVKPYRHTINKLCNLT